MTNQNRILGGLKAKNNGNEFEEILYRQALMQDFACLKIPSGCRWISSSKIIPVKTPFDYLLVKLGQTIVLDCKSTDDTNLPKAMIEWHQIDSLSWVERKGAKGGYLIWFRAANIVSFVSAEFIALNKDRTITARDGIALGTILNMNLSLLLD